MTPQEMNHAYHRSRVDVHIQGAIWFTVAMAVLALAVGDKFRPFHPGARLLEPVQLVWAEEEQGWVAQSTLIASGDYPPVRNKGPVLLQETYPTCISIMLVVGALAVAYFLYVCARRQTKLMLDACKDDPDPPYQRTWQELRVTFWALDIALAFILFFFLS